MPLHDGKVDVVLQTTLRPLTTAVLAFILFYCIDFVLRNYLNVFPKSGDCNAFTRLRNYMLSTIHALSSGMSAFGCLVLCQRLTDDIIAAENEYAYHILGFSTGYFVHDIYHNICSGLCFRSSEIILHHIAVVTCFSIVMTYRLLLPYALFGLLMELNSIFLHGRQIMLYLDISPESFWYRMNYKANIVSFVIFRLMLSTGLYIWAILHRSVLPKLVSSVLLTSFTIFTAMNFVLFWRVLASEKRILESHQLKTSKDKCTIGIHQVNGRLPEIGSFRSATTIYGSNAIDHS